MHARERISTERTLARVEAPARLHLGFLDLNGNLGRRFGSLGLAIDEPVTRLAVSRSVEFTAVGPEADRAEKAARRFADALGARGAFHVAVEEAIPAHAGLGSGTQLALSVGAAIAELEGIDAAPQLLGEIAERGARSAIGMAAFANGGFIVDGGRSAGEASPPVLIHVPVPKSWRVVLVLDRNRVGVHGEGETTAFAKLSPFSEEAAGELCRRVLMQLVPGLMAGDLHAFGEAVTCIQSIVGAHFAAAQGGSPWSSPAVGRVVQAIAKAGGVGVGQSSWGPTGFAFLPDRAAAERLYPALAREANAEGVEILIVGARNEGASIDTSSD